MKATYYFNEVKDNETRRQTEEFIILIPENETEEGLLNKIMSVGYGKPEDSFREPGYGVKVTDKKSFDKYIETNNILKGV